MVLQSNYRKRVEMKTVTGKFVDIFQVINMVSNLQSEFMRKDFKSLANQNDAIGQAHYEAFEAVLKELNKAGDLENSLILSEL